MRQSILLLTCILVLFVGCDSHDVAPAGEAVQTDAPTVSPKLIATEPEDSKSEKSNSLPVADFEPPFPHRSELFDPPRGSEVAVRRDEDQGESVELKGFLDVNGPQVVLSIDGMLSPIPEGGEKYGVQVISINPPHAVLQRGRSRWTASLE